MNKTNMKEKKAIAEKAVRMQAAECGLDEIADFLKVPLSTLKHWLRDLKAGKFDKPEKTVKPPAKKPAKKVVAQAGVDTRPELLRIAKALEAGNKNVVDLSNGLAQVCTKLDEMHKYNTEQVANFEDGLLKGLEKIGAGGDDK